MDIYILIKYFVCNRRMYIYIYRICVYELEHTLILHKYYMIIYITKK